MYILIKSKYWNDFNANTNIHDSMSFFSSSGL